MSCEELLGPGGLLAALAIGVSNGWAAKKAGPEIALATDGERLPTKHASFQNTGP
jgi:hypothetical protein